MTTQTQCPKRCSLNLQLPGDDEQLWLRLIPDLKYAWLPRRITVHYHSHCVFCPESGVSDHLHMDNLPGAFEYGHVLRSWLKMCALPDAHAWVPCCKILFVICQAQFIMMDTTRQVYLVHCPSGPGKAMPTEYNWSCHRPWRFRRAGGIVVTQLPPLFSQYFLLLGLDLSFARESYYTPNNQRH